MIKFGSVFFFIMFNATSGVAGVEDTPQWCNSGAGYKINFPYPNIKIFQFLS
jgi:hypothetical protein